MTVFFHYCVLALLLNFVSFSACAETVRIRTQAEFDAAVARINKGEETHMLLANKTFVLKEKIKAEAPLNVRGQNATILWFTESYEQGKVVREENGFLVYKQTNAITPFSLFFDEEGNLIEVAESVDEGTGVNLSEVEIVAGGNMNVGATVKIPITDNLSHLRNKTFAKAFGYFDCGWQTVNFILERSDDSYFYCKTLNNCRTNNYSYDKAVYKKAIRYVIYNAEQKSGKVYYDNQHLYVPNKYSNIYQLNCTNYNNNTPNIIVRSEFSIKSINFVGLDGIEVESGDSTVCDIESCNFKNCLGYALKVKRKEGAGIIREAKIKDCSFYDCSLLSNTIVELYSSFDGPNRILISACKLSRYPYGRVGYKNSDGGLYADGNVTFTGNVVYNTPRCHLYCNRGRIKADGNVLFNTDVFNSQIERNLSSDLGLVYCNHIYTNVGKAIANTAHTIQLKNNLIYGAYAYGGDARGIFIDNGRGDVECCDNIILNTQIYSLDSRNVSNKKASSVRNRYEGNVVTSNYRLTAGSSVEGEDVPSISSNVLLGSNANVTANAVVEKEDKTIKVNVLATCKGEKVFVSKDLHKVLKNSPAWRLVRRNIERK